MVLKQCSQCKKWKSLSEFGKAINTKDKLRSYCKECGKKYNHTQKHKQWVIDNKEKLKIYKQEWDKEHSEQLKQSKTQYAFLHKEQIQDYQKEYRLKNKKHLQELEKDYYQKNKEKIKKWSKKYYLKNREHIIKRNKNWQEQNKEKLKNARAKRSRFRRDTDFNFRILNILRGRIYLCLKGRTKADTTKKLLGCSIEFLKKHLESQFQPGMTWDNYGRGDNGKGMKEWHIDHIKPCCKFDLSKSEEQRKCFHYTNLQPLWAEENLKKGSSWDF